MLRLCPLEINCSIDSLLAEKCSLRCGGHNECVVISETRRANRHYGWRFIIHHYHRSKAFTVKYLWLWATKPRPQRQTSFTCRTAPAVTSCRTVSSHLQSNAPINNPSTQATGSFDPCHAVHAIQNSRMLIRSFICAELCGRSEQKTLCARIIDKTGSWRAVFHRTRTPCHVAQRNGTKRGRPTVARDTSRAARRRRSQKTSRASNFRFVNDVTNCCCRN